MAADFAEFVRVIHARRPWTSCRPSCARAREGLQLLRGFVQMSHGLTTTGPAPRGDAPLAPPDVPRYRFEAFLARGGMGEVWRGFDTLLAREVALKVLRGRVFEDGGARDRFREEARHVGRLEHPSIEPVHDLGERASRESRPGSGWPSASRVVVPELILDDSHEPELPAAGESPPLHRGASTTGGRSRHRPVGSRIRSMGGKRHRSREQAGRWDDRVPERSGRPRVSWGGAWPRIPGQDVVPPQGLAGDVAEDQLTPG